MTRSTILAASLALIAAVTLVSVHRTAAQDGPRPILANLAHYLEPLRPLYDLEKSFPRWPFPAAERAYGSFAGAPMKQDVDAITAIARSSRDGRPDHRSGEQIVLRRTDQVTKRSPFASGESRRLISEHS